MAQLAIAATGAVLGNALGWGIAALGLSGAAVGWAVGSLVGTFFTPNQKSQGPRLDDLKVTGTDYGQVIPWVAGSPRLAGQLVWASDRRETATTQEAGKGGGSEYTTYSYDVDLLFVLSENEIAGVSRIWMNGELVWGKDLVTEVITVKDNIWSRLTVYEGYYDQLPDPTYEAAVGAANAVAYRGRGSVFIEGLKLGSSGQIPNLTFEVGVATIVVDSDVKLLLRFNDSAGSSTILDSSPYNTPVTKSTSSSVVSGSFLGSDLGNSLRATSSGVELLSVQLANAGNIITSGPITVEGWIKLPNWTIFANYYFFTGGPSFYITYMGMSGGYVYNINYSWGVGSNNVSGFVALTLPDPLPLTFHFAYVRSATEQFFALNGSVVVSSITPTGSTFSSGFRLGGSGSAGSVVIGVEFEEIRITHRNLYSGPTFSIPDAPLPFTKNDTIISDGRLITKITDVVEQRMQKAQYDPDEYEIQDFEGAFGTLNEIRQDVTSDIIFLTQPGKGFNHFDDTSGFTWNRTFPNTPYSSITGDGRALFSNSDTGVNNLLNLSGGTTLANHSGDYTIEMRISLPQGFWASPGQYFRFFQIGKLSLDFYDARNVGGFPVFRGQNSVTSTNNFSGNIYQRFGSETILNNYLSSEFGFVDIPLMMIKQNGKEQIYFANYLIASSNNAPSASLDLNQYYSSLPGRYILYNYYQGPTIGISYFRFAKRAMYDITNKNTGVSYNSTTGQLVGDTIIQERPLKNYFVTGFTQDYGYSQGMVLSQVAPERNNLEMIRQAYFLDVNASDKIYIKGEDSTLRATIPYNDLGASEDDPLVILNENEQELSSQVAIQYANATSDFQTGVEYSDKLPVGQESTSVIQLPLGLLPSEAKRIAGKMLYDQVSKLRKITIKVPLKYSYLEPNDVIAVNNKNADRQYRLKIISRTDHLDFLEFNCHFYAEGLIQLPNTTDDSFEEQSVISLEPTIIELMDIPALRDIDTTSGYYVCASGNGVITDVWSGARLYSSFDNSVYSPSYDFTTEGVIGETTTVLGNWSQNTIDYVNTVTVDVGYKTLSSNTRANILNDVSINAALVGNEIIQFINATLVSTGVYRLSGLVRGKRNTEWARSTHSISERFVLLDSIQLGRVNVNTGQLGLLQYLKGVTSGLSFEAVAPVEFTCNAVSMKPFNPVHLRLYKYSDRVDVTWVRRTKKQCKYVGTDGIIVPLDELQIKYRVKIYKGTVLKRQVDTTENLFSYTSAMQTEDSVVPGDTITYKICQLNDVVNEGFESEIQGVI